MKVKLLTGVSGTEFNYAPGAVVDVDRDYAKRLLESGQAEAVAEKSHKRAEKRG